MPVAFSSLVALPILYSRRDRAESRVAFALVESSSINRLLRNG